MSEEQKAKCLKGLEELQTTIQKAHTFITEGKADPQKIEQLFGWLAGKTDGLRGLLDVPVSQPSSERRRGLKMKAVLLDG
jgi:hypothetical protein